MMDNIYIYEILDEEVYGIVIASSKEEAERKVKEAYKKHSSDHGEYTVIIMDKKEYEENNRWFPDSPDVLEVYSLMI